MSLKEVGTQHFLWIQSVGKYVHLLFALKCIILERVLSLD